MKICQSKDLESKSKSKSLKSDVSSVSPSSLIKTNHLFRAMISDSWNSKLKIRGYE